MKKEVKNIISQYPELSEKLFIRGYLITENDYDIEEYPFYSNWRKEDIGKYKVYVHNKTKLTISYRNDLILFLIGSVLNPFDNLYDEQAILDKLCNEFLVSKDKGLSYLNELTGNFLLCAIKKDELYLVSDPAGMLFCCYGKPNGKLHISSHAQLIADLTDVKKSDYTKDFEKYRFFYKYGLFFPGDFTQFEGITRLVQNHILKYDCNDFTIERFYPSRELKVVQNEKEYEKLVLSVKEILSNTLRLASLKWDNIAISMTGGMDSKTTLACANGFYDKYKYYSYVSMEGDKIDANAASEIAKNLNINHSIYNISTNNSDFDLINENRIIIEHNNGDYKINDNDVRKRVYFAENNLFDVEVKSWVSEIARANYYKKFGFKKMPKHLSPRNMTAMFKVFLTERSLAKRTDEIFADFINKTDFNKFPNGYDESDMYLWEFRYSAWGGMVITSEHSYSNEIFIPFNNRLLLDTMLRAPLDKRISDEFHEDIIRCANKKISDLGVTITNWNETKFRMYIEKAYFLLSSFFKNI